MRNLEIGPGSSPLSFPSVGPRPPLGVVWLVSPASDGVGRHIVEVPFGRVSYDLAVDVHGGTCFPSGLALCYSPF